jgi:tight adherence protein C
MEFLVYAMVFISLVLVFGLVFSSLLRKQIQLSTRVNELQQTHQMTDVEDDFDLPFAERIIAPTYQRFLNFLGRLTPQGVIDSYQQKIVQAGVTKEYTPLRVIGLQILAALVVVVGAVALFSRGSGETNVLLIVLMGLIAFYLPYSIIRTKAAQRKQLVERSLPDLLDLLYISVEAGLGFDAALKKTAQKMGGPLSDEILRALDDIRKGRERMPALRSIADRTEVDDVRSFIMAVIQSELLGSNIANMLRTQAKVMRERRRQRAEEKAHKLPIKMLFPLIFLMFPALFVIILGPALIKLFEMF